MMMKGHPTKWKMYVKLIRSMRSKFYKHPFQTKRLFALQLTDGQRRLGRLSWFSDSEFIYFMALEMSPKVRCKRLAKINIPSARA